MSLLLLIQALVCVLIAMRVLLFQRRGKGHRPAIAFLAYLIVITAVAVPICLMFGLSQEAHWATIPLLIEFLCAVYLSHGNIAKLYQKKSSSCMQYKPCRFSYLSIRPNTAFNVQASSLLTKHRLQKEQ